MNAKHFFGKILGHYLTLHLLAMALVVVLVCVGVGYGLDAYTHHGEGIVVPNLKGKLYEKAFLEVEQLGLNIVTSDSGYNKQMPTNAILAQTPGSGQRVKQGHVIYVTVNSPSSPTFALPDIVDNSSLREAEARLTAMGFRLTAPQRVEGEKDWVYGIVCRGRSVNNGDRLSVEYPLTLKVGKGMLDDLDSLGYADPLYEPDMGGEMGEVDDFEEVTEP